MPLKPKQERFVAAYLADMNATEAAKRAGYSPRTAGVMGHELLKRPKIAAAVAQHQQSQMEKLNITAERVKSRLAAIAFADIRSFYDADGNLLPLKDLTAEQAAAIAQFEVVKKNAEAGDGVVDRVHKIRVSDQLKALEMLAKHFGLLTEKVEHSGALEIRWAGDDGGGDSQK